MLDRENPKAAGLCDESYLLENHLRLKAFVERIVVDNINLTPGGDPRIHLVGVRGKQKNIVQAVTRMGGE
jgi:hypothetical protein